MPKSDEAATLPDKQVHRTRQLKNPPTQYTAMTKIEHTGFTATDLETSIQFYQKLGFKTLRKTNIPHAMLYLEDTVIEITQGQKPTGFHLALTTDNIEAYTDPTHTRHETKNHRNRNPTPTPTNTPKHHDTKQQLEKNHTKRPRQQPHRNMAKKITPTTTKNKTTTHQKKPQSYRQPLPKP